MSTDKRRNNYSPEADNSSLLATKTMSEADAVLPVFDWDDGNKRNYLSFRLCGYGREEACELIGIKLATMYSWRKKDAAFEALERRDVFSLRREFGKEIIALDYTRNFKLVMDHDRKVLERVKEADVKKIPLTDQDREYLHKIRPLYTLQQMEALERMFKAEDNTPQDWEAMLLVVRRTHAQNEEAVYANQEERRIEEYQEGTVIESG